MPVICDRTATVEYAVTWPTGSGWICTGTFVAMARATSTGTAGIFRAASLREHPPASSTMASALPMKMNSLFLMHGSMLDVDLDRRRPSRTERRRELPQKFRALFLELRVRHRTAHDQSRQ